MSEQQVPTPPSPPPPKIAYTLIEMSYTEGSRRERSVKNTVAKTVLEPNEETAVRHFLNLLAAKDYTEAFRVRLPKGSGESKVFMLVHEIVVGEGAEKKTVLLNQQQ